MTTPEPRRSASHFAVILSAAVASTLVIGSGLVRIWQAHRVEAAMARGHVSPFPLSDVPMQLGSWTGTKTALDPLIVEATGSTDHVTRHYVDERTGVSLDVILLYGPTNDIFIHSPELCYPKAGFATYGDPYRFERSIETQVGPIPFCSVAYQKGDPGNVDHQEVYYAWRFNGRWSTTTSSPKETERIPGMYKVQVARRILPNESRNQDNPCESFLQALMPDLESRITGPAQASKASQPRS